MQIIYMYHDDEPESGLATPGSLPDPMEAYKQTRSLFLTQRVSQASIRIDSRTKVMELKNQDVELPQNGDTLYWCRTFKLNDITRKHHLIRVSIDDILRFPCAMHTYRGIATGDNGWDMRTCSISSNMGKNATMRRQAKPTKPNRVGMMLAQFVIL